MTSIADSDAVYDRQRQLAQHQAALTLLQGILANPRIQEFRWLDLACGKGQIILHIAENLPAQARAKVRYYGYDIENDFLRYAERTAQDCGFKAVAIEVGKLHDFAAHLDQEIYFDFITLTNTVHEIRPSVLPAVILACLERLSQDGSLFIYDMEQLPALELGAITWTRLEMTQVMSALCAALGAKTYVPAVGRWTHSSCFGWNVQLQRNHLGINGDELDKLSPSALSAMRKATQRLLRSKLTACEESLQSLTKFGPETGEEDEDTVRQLYNYWALCRELEAWT